MKNHLKVLLSSMLLLGFFSTNAQISGTVFRDFNSNGAKDNTASFNEPFVSGITVKAFNSANVQLGATKTTNASGAYSFTVVEIPAATVVRIEFSGLGSGDYSSKNGTGNGTNVQFTTAPNAAINYAVNATDDYWNNTINPTPTYLVVTEARGRATAGGYQATASTVIQSTTALTGPYNPVDNTVAATGTKTTISQYQQTGSLFGLALQRKQQRYFAAAYLRRASEIGPQGPGGIYLFDKPGANFSFTGSFTLQGVTPSNGGASLDFGSVTRNFVTASNDNYFANNGNFPGENRDNDAFAKVGTMSYGDIEADPNSDKIYMLNLFQKKLIVLNTTATTAILNNATAATLAPFTTAYDILTLPGMPAATGAGNNIRPYAIKIYRGAGYLGVVSDAMTTQNGADLRGYVLQFDPNNIAAGFTTVVTINFNTWPTAGTRYWKPWPTIWTQTGGTGSAANPRDYPNPIIAGIEFNEDGSMDIGIKDRWGDQGGAFEFNAAPGATAHTQCSINGDLLHACWTGVAWALEGTPGSCTQPAANTNGAAANNSFGSGYSYGNTGLEWFADRSGDGGNENNIGGMTKLMGSGTILSTIYDPMGQGETQGSNYWSTQGIQYNNVTTGVKTQVARVLTEATNSLDKSNGMGDIEFLAEQQPIQVGNRIWTDANGNGVQDAGETTTVADGTVVTLRSPGIDGIYGNADDQTWTATTTSGNYYFSALTTLANGAGTAVPDNRKPAVWTGVANTILPGYDYRIEVATPSGLQVTRTDAGANTFDNIDNDAVANGANAFVTFNTSNTNHNFDIGFKPLASLGDRVWRDDNKDGIQDAGEPGVAGVTVTLYNNAGAVISTTVTDAYGNYLFDNLTPGTYQVGFTAPTNYSFTMQTNNTDNTVLTGGSTAANGSDVNASGRTANIVLVAGENERNIDAGLIFTQPVTNSIGDRVWFDSDGNGNQNGTEPGISGVTVTLFASDGVTVIATTITDANGNYIFTGLPASTNYIVGLTPPAGMLLTSTSGTTAGNATVNSDFSTTTFKTTVVNTGIAGTQITGVDAGFIQQATAKAVLGDKVWIDLSGGTANVQDVNEPGLPGVTVELLDGTGASIDPDGAGPLTKTEMITDAFGNYIFNNLDAATYRVKFILPSGYTFVTQNSGADDFKDSDANTGTGQTGNYPMVAGQRNLSIDAGVTQNSPAGTARLGDKVWFDANGNGTQDATEVGVAGVTVTLYTNGVDGLPGTADDVVVGTTATDANGNYQFVNLAANNYNVGFSNLPAGYSFTPIWVSDDANSTNSDANPGTGRTGTITLSAGEIEQDVDAGLIAGVSSGLGSIGNKVWWDIVTNNNVQDAGEPGVPGVTVNLDYDINGDGDFLDIGEAGYKTTTTNALGEYLFTGLPAGAYRVRFTNLPTGSSTVTQNSGANDNTDSDGSAVVSSTGVEVSTTGVYNLAVGEDNLSVDLGITNTAKGSLGNRVWSDNGTGGGTANDGIQNGTEGGVAGVTVTLVNAAGQTVDRAGIVTTTPITTTTDNNGYYAFADLTAGVSFAVLFSNAPAGFDFTTKAGAGGGDDNRSDANLISGLTPAVAIVANTFNSTLDAGITSTRAALGNYVWLDTNGDGIQDVTEAGVAGVTVSLYRPGFGPDGIAGNSDDALAVASMITDQNGQYLFTNLIPGTYQVEFSTIPGGLSFTKQNTPGDNGDNTNSDAVPVTGNTSVGRTGNVILIAGETDLTIDAGLFKPRAVIGNFVWVDGNSNGLQDAGEPGLSGVIVTLIDAGGNPVAIAVTDANGGYQFPNVAPGTYSLSFTNLPSGVLFTTPNVGGNDNIDSDVTGTTITGIVVTTTTVNLSFDAGVIGAITLPARLEFIALKQTNTAKLIWKVTQEENVARYELEHSTDGISYNVINNQTRNGSTEYQYLDVQPAQGINFYRVRIVDNNGRITYSDIRTVIFSKDGQIFIFPNPAAGGTVNIQLPDSWQNKKITIDIMNQLGQIISSRNSQQASQVETLDVGKLSNGSYLLRMSNENGEIETRKIMVNR